MLSDGNQTDGNSLERFLTPYQHSRLPLSKISHSCMAQHQIVQFFRHSEEMCTVMRVDQCQFHIRNAILTAVYDGLNGLKCNERPNRTDRLIWVIMFLKFMQRHGHI